MKEGPTQLVQCVLGKRAMQWAKEHLASVREATEDESRMKFFAAFCAIYARPFTNNHGIGMLPACVVPDEMRDVHDSLRAYRNQVAAHADSGRDHGGIPVNSVRVEFLPSGVVVGDFLPHGSPDFLTRAEALVDAVAANLNKWMVPMIENHVTAQRLPPGEYYLVPGDRWDLRPVPSGIAPGPAAHQHRTRPAD